MMPSNLVSGLQTEVDLAIIAHRIHTVVDIVSECVEKKVGVPSLFQPRQGDR